MAVTFDTHKAVTRLREKAGFDEKEATGVVETVADVLVDNLATREDMAMLRKEMSVGMATLRSEMSADMATMRADLKGDIHEMRAEMHKQGQRMTTRLGAVAGAAVGIIVAFDKLF